MNLKNLLQKFPFFFPIIILLLTASTSIGQTPAIRLIQPYSATTTVNSARQFIIGSVEKNSALSINGETVRVYPTGAFVHELNLKAGSTSVELKAVQPGGRESYKTIRYVYELPPAPKPVGSFDIESIQIFPEGNLILRAGDRISFKVKALPGQSVSALGFVPLYERPVTTSEPMAGIYQGSYTLLETDSFSAQKVFARITGPGGNSRDKYTGTTLSTAEALPSDMAQTIGRLAHLEYGLGDDRLGGAKIGYLDSNVRLNITGKIGSDYRVELTKNRSAFIPEEHIRFLPAGSPAPQSLTGKLIAYGDERFDYVKLNLTDRLPYQSMQQTDPAALLVDVFGATNNTNWVTHLSTAREIKQVEYEQLSDGIYRIKIMLHHKQHWGHQIYYNGKDLVIKVRRQPADPALHHLTIAIDAGHGGKNNGAVGATGVYEKELTLLLSLELKKVLEKKGAKIIMTRTTDSFFDNKQRILFYRDSLPDLLLSIHLNSSEDPLKVSGTSCYYRYAGFSKLAGSIHRHLQELGLKDYGLTGSFNFMLNSPTEYPNALVETLFLSHPEEEMKMLDPPFRHSMADKIVEGIEHFLHQSRN
jgi:N-acetylmuramoyl-L-alanine amidase